MSKREQNKTQEELGSETYGGDEQNWTLLSGTVTEPIHTINRYVTHLTLDTMLFRRTHSMRNKYKIKECVNAENVVL